MKIFEWILNLILSVVIALTALHTINKFYNLDFFESCALSFIICKLVTALNNIQIKYIENN